MKPTPLAIAALAARIVLAAVFVWAACVKIAHPDAFALAVSRYPILVGPFSFLVNPVAIVLPWVELASGLAVLLTPPRTRAGAALLLAAMLLVFTLAITILLASGQTTSCGCFSVRADAASSNAWNIVRNLLLLLATALVLADAHTSTRPHRTPLLTKYRIPLS